MAEFITVINKARKVCQKIDCTKCELNECGKCVLEDIHLTKVDVKKVEETIEKLYRSNIFIKCWKPYFDFRGDWWGQYTCPYCEKRSEYKTNYCPHCGAKVESDPDDD